MNRSVFPALAVICLCSCSGRNAIDKSAYRPDTASESIANAHAENPHDSLAVLQAAYEEYATKAQRAHDELQSLYTRFELVDDPMLVERYRVPKGWKNHDTTGEPGILARVLEDGRIEIVAVSLSEFSSFTLSSGNESVSSPPVPPGSALHASVNGMTRVAFNQVADIAEFADRHRDDEITLTYSSGVSHKLSAAQRAMIADTWLLSRAQANAEAMLLRENTALAKLENYKIKHQ